MPRADSDRSASRCGLCGNPLLEGARFCTSCGAKASQVPCPNSAGRSDQDLAGFWPRVGAFALDGVVASAALAVIVFVLALFAAIVAGSPALAGLGAAEGILVVIGYPVLFPLTGLVWGPPYHAFALPLWGRTLGMRWLRLQVVTAEGGRPTWRTSLKRAVASYASFILWLGYLWAAWDPKQQTWHDKIAGTLVVTTSW